MTAQTPDEPLDECINIMGPDDRDPEDNEDYEPGHEWTLTCYQDELSDLVGSYGDTLQTQRLIEAHLPRDVQARLSFDSEGGMLAAYGSEADIRTLASVMQGMHRRRT